jgi:hypothetical protein
MSLQQWVSHFCTNLLRKRQSHDKCGWSGILVRRQWQPFEFAQGKSVERRNEHLHVRPAKSAEPGGECGNDAVRQRSCGRVNATADADEQWSEHRLFVWRGAARAARDQRAVFRRGWSWQH